MTMKKTIGIKRNSIIIIIGILLSACTQKENASQQALLLELVQAEAVMYEHPDSALGVLQRDESSGIIGQIAKCYLGVANSASQV